MDPAAVPVSLFDLLNFAATADVDEFAEAVKKFETGVWSPDDFKKYRLARGTYGQRQSDVNMIRVKIPQGILSADQLDALGEVAERYSRGIGHVTTRQNIQFHFCQLKEVEAAQRLLASVGLTTREACGNTVRNITACPYSGVAPGSVFDVTPWAQATTRHFLRNPICQNLPRKFKIAFSCGHDGDCAQGAINDVGLRAIIKDGVEGFRMAIGGGLSTSPEDAHVLFDFVAADEMIAACEAVVKIFDRTGNRQNKARARLKYVIRKFGWDETRKMVLEELDKIRAEGRGKIAVDIEPAQKLLRPRLPVAGAKEPTNDEAYVAWKKTNTMAQKQPGYVAVTVRLVRGDATKAQWQGLATLVRKRGDGTVRLTNDQNLVAHNVPASELGAFFHDLAGMGLAKPGVHTLEDVTSCPGAESCNLAVTASRELASAISAAIEADTVHREAVWAARDADIKISGCPNSCGQHHIAAIGFHGTVRRVGGKAMPEYQLHLGGGISTEGATFGRQVVKLPAHRVAQAVLRLVDLYAKEKQPDEAARAFFQRVDDTRVKTALADLTKVDETTMRPEEFQDLGAQTAFSVQIGAGECAA